MEWDKGPSLQQLWVMEGKVGGGEGRTEPKGEKGKERGHEKPSWGIWCTVAIVEWVRCEPRAWDLKG